MNKLMLYAGQDGRVAVTFCHINDDDTRTQHTLFVRPWADVIAFLGEVPFTDGPTCVKVSA